MSSFYNRIEFYLFKLMIMLPALFLLFYVFPSIALYINYYIFIPIIVLPVLRVFLKERLGSLVYPIFTIAFLLITLYSYAYLLGIYQNRILNTLLLRYNYETIISLMMGIGILILEEGILTRKLYRTVGSLIVSNLFFLEQFAAIYLMNNPGAIPSLNFSNMTYFEAFSTIAYLEIISLYSFIVNGYEYLLPLATFSLPYSRVILFLFLLSIVSLLLFLYRSEKRWLTERGVSLGYAVVIGSMLAAIGVFILDRLNTYYYGDSFLLFFVVGVTAVAIYSSRKSYNQRIDGE